MGRSSQNWMKHQNGIKNLAFAIFVLSIPYLSVATIEQSNQPLNGYTQEYANELSTHRVARNPAAVSATNAFIAPAVGRFFSRMVPEVVSRGATKFAGTPVIGTGLRQLGSEGMYMGKNPVMAGVGAFSTLYMGKKLTIG
ncbi:hypothetical protein Ddc_11805 [Ditylenchus destructor]|nr:hypothetical protein Ddc_11805 [Ditylenchus destructor]